MGQSDFYIDYQLEIEDWNDELQSELETKLFDLADEDTDLVGAAVAITQPAHASTPYLYQTRIVVYGRPDDVAATETSDSIQGSVKGALDAIIKQVRKKREKLGEPWKREDLKGSITADADEAEARYQDFDDEINVDVDAGDKEQHG
jgi:ribosome-associated translation inhibitor RaiA